MWVTPTIRLEEIHNGAQKSLANVDTFAKDLHQAIALRNLTHIVDVIFVSDHGMTDTSSVQSIFLDDILGDDGFKSIEHVYGSFLS